MTVAWDRAIELFLAERRTRGLSDLTVRGNHFSLKRFRLFLEERGIESLSDVTAAVLADYQVEVMVRGSLEGGPLGVTTQAHRISTIRLFFRFLLKHGYLLVNPAQDLAIPHCPRRPPDRVLDEASVKRLLLAPDLKTPLGVRDRAILEVLYATGVRVAELVGLNVADLALSDEELRVQQGKGGKGRQLPMGAIACNWVQRYLEEVRPKLLRRRPHEPALFLSFRGYRLHPYNLLKAMHAYGRVANIRIKVTPHVLRHTFATHMLKGKASLRHIQEMLGHTNLMSTQIYTKVDISDLKEVHRRCHPRGRD